MNIKNKVYRRICPHQRFVCIHDDLNFTTKSRKQIWEIAYRRVSYNPSTLNSAISKTQYTNSAVSKRAKKK